MYAIVETGGKQYTVRKGDLIRVEKLCGERGDVVELDTILLLDDGADTLVGKPTVAGAKVVATIRAQGRGKKIIIFKYKRRKNYRRKQGHRQGYTLLAIEDIVSQGGSNGA
jgi:large subunit ribosomal protein L21